MGEDKECKITPDEVEKKITIKCEDIAEKEVTFKLVLGKYIAKDFKPKFKIDGKDQELNSETDFKQKCKQSVTINVADAPAGYICDINGEPWAKVGTQTTININCNLVVKTFEMW